MNKKWMWVLLAASVLTVAGAYYARAQMGGGQRQGGQAPMGMMGGGSAMVVYDKYIYVLSGPVLLKVNPVSMKIEKELSLGKKAPSGAKKQGGDFPPFEED